MGTISERVEQIKIHFGLNNVQLGEMAGCSKQRVGNWINLNQQPALDALLNLRKNLSINDEWLITGKGKMIIQEDEFIRAVRELHSELSESEKKKILEDIHFYIQRNRE